MEVTAALLPGPGRLDRMALGTISVGEPGPGRVRLLVRACGLNPVDAKLAVTGVPGWAWPHVPGLDIVGAVESLGPGVPQTWSGRRVAVHHDLREPGGLAGAVVVDAAALALVPDRLDDASAAALPCPGLTARQAVVRTGVAAGDRVLIVGAGGSVGTYAVQLAARTGAEVVAVCAGADAARVLGLGASTTIDHRRDDVMARGRSFGGFDVVLDLVGSHATAATLGLLAYGGRFASVERPALSHVEPFTIAPTVVEIALGGAYPYGRLRDREALGSGLAALLDADLQPPPVQQVALADAGAALQGILDGSSAGKMVALIAD